MTNEPAPSAAPATPPAHVIKGLTTRETQVAKALAAGFSNREVASALGVSIKTIDTHRGHIMKKLELKNNVELFRWMLRGGYVTL